MSEIDHPDWPPIHLSPRDADRQLRDEIVGLRRELPKLTTTLFGATLLGTALGQHLRPEVLTQLTDLASRYPVAAGAMGLFLALGLPRVAPPDDPRWRPLWELWARVIPFRWDTWLPLLKLPGTVVPEPPPPSKPPPPDDQDPPTLRPGEISLAPGIGLLALALLGVGCGASLPRATAIEAARTASAVAVCVVAQGERRCAKLEGVALDACDARLSLARLGASAVDSAAETVEACLRAGDEVCAAVAATEAAELLGEVVATVRALGGEK
jgi:hypothetical protein